MSLWSVRRNRVDKYLCTSRLGPSDLPDDMWRMDQVNTISYQMMRQSEVYPGDKIQSLQTSRYWHVYTVTYKRSNPRPVVVALPAAKSLRVSISLKQQ